jgi:prepilin-type N-terminal cleavage/methylation domain-containing protein
VKVAVRRGFTLLEALVALAITALVLTAVWGAVARAAVARRRTAERAERTALARGVLLRLATELGGAVAASEPAAPERFVVVPPADGLPVWSELRFATAAAELVGYRVQASAESATRGVLVRRAASRFAPPEAGEPAAVPVLAPIRTFGVRCFDGAAWRRSWSVPGVPRAVELTLGVDDGAGGTDVLTTRVAVPLAGGGS